MANLNTVLDKVNAARVAAGAHPLDALPRGRKGNAESCPLARAFQDAFPGARVGSELTGVPDTSAPRVASAMGGAVADNFSSIIRLPHELRQFVRDFDNGVYPHLDE